MLTRIILEKETRVERSTHNMKRSSNVCAHPEENADRVARVRARTCRVRDCAILIRIGEENKKIHTHKETLNEILK